MSDDEAKAKIEALEAAVATFAQSLAVVIRSVDAMMGYFRAIGVAMEDEAGG